MMCLLRYILLVSYYILILSVESDTHNPTEAYEPKSRNDAHTRHRQRQARTSSITSRFRQYYPNDADADAVAQEAQNQKQQRDRSCLTSNPFPFPYEIH